MMRTAQLKTNKIQNNKKSDTHNMYTKQNNIENKTTEKPKPSFH